QTRRQPVLHQGKPDNGHLHPQAGHRAEDGHQPEILVAKSEIRMTKSEGNPKLEVRKAAAFRNSLFCILSSLVIRHSSFGTAADPIPDRPEKLTFPPLAYEPPAPERFRVQLKSGPIAYVVPDHELPLVNIVLYVHTGRYLDPAGKEGLADLTGYLLA